MLNNNIINIIKKSQNNLHNYFDDPDKLDISDKKELSKFSKKYLMVCANYDNMIYFNYILDNLFNNNFLCKLIDDLCFKNNYKYVQHVLHKYNDKNIKIIFMKKNKKNKLICPLLSAAKHKNFELIELLINNGASINLYDFYFIRKLEELKLIDVLDFLKKKKYYKPNSVQNVIYDMIANNNIDFTFLENNNATNLISSNILNYILKCSECNNISFFSYILDNVLKKNDYLCFIINELCKVNNETFIFKILNKFEDVKLQFFYKKIPIIPILEASINKNFKLIDCLIYYGTSIDFHNYYYITCLQNLKLFDIIEYIKNKGYYVEKKNIINNTTLYNRNEYKFPIFVKNNDENNKNENNKNENNDNENNEKLNNLIELLKKEIQVLKNENINLKINNENNEKLNKSIELLKKEIQVLKDENINLKNNEELITKNNNKLSIDNKKYCIMLNEKEILIIQAKKQYDNLYTQYCALRDKYNDLNNDTIEQKIISINTEKDKLLNDNIKYEHTIKKLTSENNILTYENKDLTAKYKESIKNNCIYEDKIYSINKNNQELQRMLTYTEKDLHDLKIKKKWSFF